MPLNRDHQYLKKQTRTNADVSANRDAGSTLQENPSHTLDKPSTSQKGGRETTGRHSSENSDRSQGFSNMHTAQDLQKMKLPLPDGPFRKSEPLRSMPPASGQGLTSRQSTVGSIQNERQSKKSKHIPASAFDDTESFNHSELDQDGTEQVTAVLRLEELGHSDQQRGSTVDRGAIAPNTQAKHPTAQATSMSRDLQIEFEMLQHDKKPEAHAHDNRLDFTALPEDFIDQDFDDIDIDMDTPSRPQPLPRPHVTYGTKKKVEFVGGIESFGGSMGSPYVKSAELAREFSPDMGTTRLNSIQQLGDTNFEDDRKQRDIVLHNRPKSALVMHGTVPSRFTKMHEHNLRVLEQSDKVSAPESDVQESSDEERAEVTVTGRHDTDIPISNATKRGRDLNTAPEYTLEEMRGKKLSDLQKESFLRSPLKTATELPKDGHQSVSLSDQLLRLHEQTEDEQRTMFRAQNDEEWSQTAQWFVEKFREDMEKLVAIRLERRKIALRYEDQLRRRQKEVEWAQAGVEQELRELESGGGELIRNRKTPSRAGTPMKSL